MKPFGTSQECLAALPARSLLWRQVGLLSLLAPLMLAACGGGGAPADTGPSAQESALRPPPAPPAPTPVPPPATPPTADARFAVGDQLFHEPRLSASGRLSCASCHAATNGHADPAGTFLPLGGPSHDQQGARSSPSLRYLDNAGAFRINAQGQALGGLTWDGRANSRSEQARSPLFAANEMANASVEDFAARLRSTPAWNALLSAYNLRATATPAQLLAATQDALARYQADDEEFHAFNSKFDEVQAGRASFTAAEQRGLNAFNDPQRGNCASCHTSRGARPLFTNFEYHALGVPRNSSVATQTPAFFDLGLCGPQRTDLASQTEQCGRFKVPTLRNVALSAPYFHNARFNTLEEVVRFYATRDTNPAAWYPTVNGQVQRFNDLPLQYQANVERRPPFGQQAGQRPRLSEQDITDIVAFLRTLNDAPPPPASATGG
ncbi:MAG: cytochrome-c peroxidase [Burkholderiales bacterium]